MSRTNTVMLVGVGGVGYEALQLLCCEPRIDRIVAADVVESTGRMRTTTAQYRADHLGYEPDVEFVEIDLFDTAGVVTRLEEHRPDVVYAAATVLPWGAFEALPKDVRDPLFEFTPDGPGFGPIVPGQIPLMYNLMEAVREADVPEPHVINTSLPDVVNPALDRVGLGPTVGSGNVGHLVPPIRQIAGEMFDVPRREVDVYFSMPQSGVHAAIEENSTAGVPYYLKVFVDGNDVSESIDLETEFSNRNLPFPSPLDEQGVNVLTGTISARLVTALLSPTGERLHAPAPNGLEGGFPVRLSRDGAEVVLPDDTSVEEVEAINREGLRYNGIERIEEDGTVVFTDTTRDVMAEYYDIDVESFTAHDALDLTEDIIHGYERLAEEHGVEPRMGVTW